MTRAGILYASERGYLIMCAKTRADLRAEREARA